MALSITHSLSGHIEQLDRSHSHRLNFSNSDYIPLVAIYRQYPDISQNDVILSIRDFSKALAGRTRKVSTQARLPQTLPLGKPPAGAAGTSSNLRRGSNLPPAPFDQNPAIQTSSSRQEKDFKSFPEKDFHTDFGTEFPSKFAVQAGMAETGFESIHEGKPIESTSRPPGSLFSRHNSLPVSILPRASKRKQSRPISALDAPAVYEEINPGRKSIRREEPYHKRKILNSSRSLPLPIMTRNKVDEIKPTLRQQSLSVLRGAYDLPNSVDFWEETIETPEQSRGKKKVERPYGTPPPALEPND